MEKDQTKKSTEPVIRTEEDLNAYRSKQAHRQELGKQNLKRTNPPPVNVCHSSPISPLDQIYSLPTHLPSF